MSYNDDRFKKITLNTRITLLIEHVKSTMSGALTKQTTELPLYARLYRANQYMIQNSVNTMDNITCRYIVRYRDNISTKHSIKIKDDIYDIVGIENMLMADRYLILSLSLRGNNRKAQNGIG